MARIALDLNKPEDRAKVGGGVWRQAMGLVPGEPNQGLVAEILAAPPRLAGFDDSGWAISNNIREPLSVGFTFGWWRITVQFPETIDGHPIAGSNVLFETNVDNYGEVWVDGNIDLVSGVVVGFNSQQRVVVDPKAEAGAKHVIAVLAANGPLSQPRGAIFLRYATLAFETRG